MRIRTFFLAIPIGVLPALVMAQTPATPAPAGAQVPASASAVDEEALPTTYGSLDLGVRASHVDGDDARYERYRDIGNGLFLESARYNTERKGWMLGVGLDHLGRRDQRFAGSAILPGRFKVKGQWDQIPMLMSRTTRTLFTTTSPGVLEIDNAIQAAAQASAASLAGAASQPVELSSRRHIFDAAAEYIGQYGLTVNTNVRHTNRDGVIPYGGSFGHSQVVETMAPVRHGLTDFESGAEFARGDLLVRGGYHGSWFKNELTSLTFDNPWRVSDVSGTSSRGRLALAPSNSFVGVNGLVSYKLPYKTRVNLSGSTGSLRDAGDPLLPFTINSAVVSPALDRTATEGHAKTSSVNFNVVSRPVQTVDIDLRVRTYDYDNRTPEFSQPQRVAYDNTVSNVTNAALLHSEPFGVKRNTVDADVRVSPIRSLSGGVGFSHQAEERTHRIFEETTDNVFRLTADLFARQNTGGVYGLVRSLTVRTKFEHAERRGKGDAAEIAAELTAINEQSGMRHFDIASRNRNRVTVVASANPINMMTLSGSFAKGKDDYLESLFGLRDNAHQVYSAGVDVSPSDYYGAGLSYSFERYTSLSRSRQASNATEQLDASRNWATDTADRAHSIVAHAEMLDFKQLFDITLFVDYNRSRGTYNYITGSVPNRTLPEETILPTTLPDPTQLPPVKSALARSNLDVVYKLSERWGLGLSVWYERYRVEDFSLDASSITLDPLRAVLLGYQYLPYTAKTVWGRAVYKF